MDFRATVEDSDAGDVRSVSQIHRCAFTVGALVISDLATLFVTALAGQNLGWTDAVKLVSPLQMDDGPKTISPQRLTDISGS
jgi:hypothetical protein